MLNWSIRRLNTGWIESAQEVSFFAGGRTTAGPLRTTGWSEEIPRPDGTVGAGAMVPCPAWYLESDAGAILVDTGVGDLDRVVAAQSEFGLALGVRAPADGSLVEQLARLGVEADGVETVVQTHLHFDHVGENSSFPRARFVVHEAELPWALAAPPFARTLYYPAYRDEVRSMLARAELVAGDATIAPGIRMVHTGGHSPGHCALFVDTAHGEVVLAGDAAFNYRNVECGWPPGVVVDLPAAARAIETLRRADIILLNHDPLIDDLLPGGVLADEPLPARTLEYMASLRRRPSHAP
jgi:N-acyl homoserine lactone hydrolase